jgi:hypothetical protein
MLVTGLSFQGVERWRNYLERRNEYTISKDQSNGCHTFKKSSAYLKQSSPVPETDTGRVVEYTEERERTLLKELGKMTLYLRKKECLKRLQYQVPSNCLAKTQVSAKL